MQIVFSSLCKKARKMAIDREMPEGVIKPNYKKLRAVVKKINDTYKEVCFFGRINRVKLASILDFMSKQICLESTFSQCIDSNKALKMMRMANNIIYVFSFVENLETNHDQVKRLAVALLIEEVIFLMKISKVHYSFIDFVE